MEDDTYEEYRDIIEESFYNFISHQEEIPEVTDNVAGHEGTTVVVYSGPTSLDRGTGKNWLYLKNFEYFLDHGIGCAWQDTVVVVTKPVADHYSHRIKKIQEKCLASGSKHTVTLLEREDKCYDMETLLVVFEKVDLSPYDYFVYLNCGVVGPKLPLAHAESPWTYHYTSILSETVKMSGLSINCASHPHVQSMLFAVDKVGLKIIMSSECVYDCNKANADMDDDDKMNIIRRYEVGMGRAVIGAGYGIASILGTMGPIKLAAKDLDRDLDWCEDIWHPNALRLFGNGEVPSWEDLVFFKSSRPFILSDIYYELEYGHPETVVIVENGGS
jgi:hypothetical protein